MHVSLIYMDLTPNVFCCRIDVSQCDVQITHLQITSKQVATTIIDSASWVVPATPKHIGAFRGHGFTSSPYFVLKNILNFFIFYFAPT